MEAVLRSVKDGIVTRSFQQPAAQCQNTGSVEFPAKGAQMTRPSVPNAKGKVHLCLAPENSSTRQLLLEAGGFRVYRRANQKRLTWSSFFWVLPWIMVAPRGFAGVRPPRPSMGENHGRYKIHVSVKLVVLPVSVTDQKGNVVPDLHVQNFHVYDNGHPEKIVLFKHEDIPVTVGLAVDNSSSMLPKRRDVEDALLVFARSSNPRDQMFVVNFSDTASICPPDDVLFTDQPALLRKCVDVTPGGRTALYDAIATALCHLRLGTRPKKSLIIVSDGGDDASHYKLRQVLHMAENSNAIIYAIGLFAQHQTYQDPGVLRKFAKATGGVAYFPGSPSAVKADLRDIAQDLREQYVLAFVPPSKSNVGIYHRVRVKVRAPRKGKLHVRTRTGYYMPAPGTP